MSARIAAGSPACCTFTATCRPSERVALCTCAARQQGASHRVSALPLAEVISDPGSPPCLREGGRGGRLGADVQKGRLELRLSQLLAARTETRKAPASRQATTREDISSDKSTPRLAGAARQGAWARSHHRRSDPVERLGRRAVLQRRESLDIARWQRPHC